MAVGGPRLHAACIDHRPRLAAARRGCDAWRDAVSHGTVSSAQGPASPLLARKLAVRAAVLQGSSRGSAGARSGRRTARCAQYGQGYGVAMTGCVRVLSRGASRCGGGGACGAYLDGFATSALDVYFCTQKADRVSCKRINLRARSVCVYLPMCGFIVYSGDVKRHLDSHSGKSGPRLHYRPMHLIAHCQSTCLRVQVTRFNHI